MSQYVPERGDVIWINFTPQSGHEQAGKRPAFVISPFAYNKKVGLAICCPITSQIKGYPFEVVVPQGCDVVGAILTDQVKSLDWHSRNAKFVSKLPSVITKEVLAKLATLIQ